MSNMVARDLVQGHINYLYTSPVGAVVVILGVPALINPDDSSDYTFSRQVAKRVQEIVKTSLSLNSAPNSVTSHNFEESINLPPSTVEVVFRGDNVQYGRVPLRTLRKSIERVDTSYRAALVGYSEFKGFDTSPFAEVVDTGYESMRLVMNAVAWLNGDEAALSDDVINDAELFDSLLKAAQELAPGKNDVFTEVEIVSASHEQVQGRAPMRERATLRNETRLRAEVERKVIALRSSRTRQVYFTGIIDGLREQDFKTREGILHIKVKKSPEDWTSSVAEFIYDNVMLRNILTEFSRGGEYVFRV
jgi:hypothetical protein